MNAALARSHVLQLSRRAFFVVFEDGIDLARRERGRWWWWRGKKLGALVRGQGGRPPISLIFFLFVNLSVLWSF